MSELIQISIPDNSKQIVDVIFIHGLDGDARITWQTKNTAETFWPQWIAEDVPNSRVWSLSYKVSSASWRGKTMPLVERATEILAEFSANDIGTNPIVFITHSMGGLVIKQALRNAIDAGAAEWLQIVDQTKGIVFLSTPHNGAAIASWIDFIGTFYRSTVTIEELKEHNPYLQNLNQWYRDNVAKLDIKNQVYYEKYKTGNILVVNAISSDPGIAGVRPIPIDGDHLSICRPSEKKDKRHKLIVRFIRDCSSQIPPSSPHPLNLLVAAGLKGKTAELIEILNERARIILSEVGQYYNEDDFTVFATEFQSLHERHINALSQEKIQLAHELLGQIHEVCIRLEYDHDQHNNNNYRLTRYMPDEAALERGKVICAYIAGDITTRSNKYPAVIGFWTGRPFSLDDTLNLYKTMLGPQ